MDLIVGDFRVLLHQVEDRSASRFILQLNSMWMLLFNIANQRFVLVNYPFPYTMFNIWLLNHHSFFVLATCNWQGKNLTSCLYCICSSHWTIMSPVELASVFTKATTIAHALIFCFVSPTYLLQKMQTRQQVEML